MADLITVCEGTGRWPEALWSSVVVLIPRPMAARRPFVRQWVVGHGADGAKEPGRGAEDWQLARLNALGPLPRKRKRTVRERSFAAFSWCYERVALQQLDDRASGAGFPDHLLVLALQVYSGPRHIRVGQAVAAPRRGTAGIMAGCGLAVALLRAHLREAVLAAAAAVVAVVTVLFCV